ncbi:MAG: AMP-binding protein [Planctomycetota bacterium]|jgi:acyl-CoA synthetase (AMP-forming)/AMP-acid ligase II
MNGGVHALLARAAEVMPGATAFECDGRAWRYAEVERAAASAAAELLAEGVGPGERVALLAENGPEYLVWTFAIARVGAVVQPLNTRLAVPELEAGLALGRTRLVLHTARFAELAASLSAPSRGIRVGALEPGPGCPPHPVSGDDMAFLYTTSGTTGRPKGVVLTHANVVAHALAACIELELTAADTWAHIAPMFHLADAWATLALTLVGARHVFLPTFEAGAALDLFEAERVTLTNLVPTMLGDMVRHESAPERRFPALRLILSGGAPIAPAVVRQVMEVFRAEYVQTYGMTETSPYLTLSRLAPQHAALSAEEQFALRARTGRPFLGVELEVVDESGAPVPADDAAVGEIRVRGASVTPGYFEDSEATAAALRAGWLYTGDLARVDAHGFVEIVDRKKDMILSGGENIYSTEVEAVLHEHPSVAEVAVFGLPDERWGERVTAAIVPGGGAEAGAVLEQELNAFCRSRLAAYKAPKEWHFTDALPRTGTGKISKRELRSGLESKGRP